MENGFFDDAIIILLVLRRRRSNGKQIKRMSIPITLKHGKITHEVCIPPGSSAQELKLQIETLTRVPPSRQKLLCPKLWKGPLKDDETLPKNMNRAGKKIVITLIGTAETMVEKSMDERPQFVEDLTPEELWKLKRAAMGKSEENDRIDIVALQKEIGMERDEDSNKMEAYQYNRLVTGLPQHRINDLLMQRQRKPASDDDSVGKLHGTSVMTLGMELRRAYINSLDVLSDGSIVSGLDDGHIQIWRRGEMVKDARHVGSRVDHVLTFPENNKNVAFLTAGDGSICLWNQEYEHVNAFPSYPGTTPASLAVGTTVGSNPNATVHYIAACFRITRQVDQHQFWLVPQTDAERRRREAAELQERMIQNQLLVSSRTVKLWHYTDGDGNFREDAIITDNESSEAPAITNLIHMNENKLVCGDEGGGLRVWSLESNQQQQSLSRQETARLQIKVEGDNSNAELLAWNHCQEQIALPYHFYPLHNNPRVRFWIRLH